MYLGIILHLLSNVSFVLGSYAMHFFLGRYLSEAGYGMVGTVITIMNFEYIFFTDGMRQSISKALSGGKYEESSIIRTGIFFQMMVIGIFFIGTFMGAGTIAASLGDNNISPYIRNIAFLLPFTGMHSLMLGILNGKKAFGKEAGVSFIYPILKLSVIPSVLFVFKNDATLGVQAGFIFAAVCVCGISFILVKELLAHSDPNEGYNTLPPLPAAEYISTAASYLALFGAATFMMNLDTLILKRVSGADELVGYYTGVVNFAKIPYYLLTACYTVALPVITESYARGDRETAAGKTGDILTLILSFIIPVVTVISASSRQILSVFYKPSYGVGDDALSLLIFGTAFLGMMLFYSTVLSGADKKRIYIGASISALVLQAVLCSVFTGLFSITGTAAATFMAAMSGMLICHVGVYRTFGVFWKRQHTLLLLSNILFFAVYFILFRSFVRTESFIVLALICGVCLVTALIPGGLYMMIKRKKRMS